MANDFDILSATTLLCTDFYRRKQVLLYRVVAIAILSVRPSVRLFIRLSHGWISQKRCKLKLPNFHCWRAGRLVADRHWHAAYHNKH